MRRQWSRGTRPGRLLARLIATVLLAGGTVGLAAAHYGPDGDGGGGAAGGGGLILVGAVGLVLVGSVGAYLYRHQRRAAAAESATDDGNWSEDECGSEDESGNEDGSGSGADGTDSSQ